MNNILILPKEIFLFEDLMTAIDSYKSISNISVTSDNSNFFCEFTNKSKYKIDIIIKEFENYLIDYSNTEKRYDS